MIPPDDFRRLAIKLGDDFDADLFLSGGGFASDRMSYLGIAPERELLITPDLSAEPLKDFAYSDELPTFGFLSYPDRSPSHRADTFPAGHMRKYGAILGYNEETHELVISTRDSDLQRDLRSAVAVAPPSLSSMAGPTPMFGDLRHSLDRDEYIERVKAVLEYIQRGDIYQMCLSIAFELSFENFPDVDFYNDLFQQYPAPFYVWYKTDPYQIISTSPERFLQVRDGQVRSQPIKGTRELDSDPDDAIRHLLASPKEDAELSMIVDLIRNDISKSCEYGSVRVRNHKSVMTVDNLLQMYSTVEGRLRDENCCLDLLMAAFPGGSVTGCPKKRAMELIDELEPHSRDIYCGSFFILWGPRDMDSSIAIRTGYFDRALHLFRFYAGSGIVVDSDPASEYDETMAKARKFLRAAAYHRS